MNKKLYFNFLFFEKRNNNLCLLWEAGATKSGSCHKEWESGIIKSIKQEA